MMRPRVHTHNCGRTGRADIRMANCRMDCPCWCHKSATVTYSWLHLPTGRTGVTTRKFDGVLSEMHQFGKSSFFELMNCWNRIPEWKYWQTMEQETESAQ